MAPMQSIANMMFLRLASLSQPEDPKGGKKVFRSIFKNAEAMTMKQPDYEASQRKLGL